MTAPGSAPDYGPPVDAAGRVPGIDAEPTPPPPLDPPVDTIRLDLDATGSGHYPSLYLVEVAGTEVRTFALSRDSLPDRSVASWRTRQALRALCVRAIDALDRIEHEEKTRARGPFPMPARPLDDLRRPRG